MSVPVEDKKVYKGQHKDYEINVSDILGKTDITGWTIAFNVKETVGGDSIITKTTSEITEIKITDESNGVAELYLLPADTSELTVGRYYYDIWITDLNSKTRPIITGYFWITDVAPTMVNEVRELLGEAGEEQVLPVTDFVKPSSLSIIHVNRTRIQEVKGVWLYDDSSHTGTNYFAGGGFNAKNGEIWLGTPLPDIINFVQVEYTWQSGITDDAVNWHLWSAGKFVKSWTGIVVEYGAGSMQGEFGEAAEAMALARTIIGCVLTINGANVAQMGYNFRLDEFEIQTKLWGEGMIAEALFNLYIRQYDEWKQAIGKKGYTVVATPDSPKYNLSNLVNYTDDSIEGS